MHHCASSSAPSNCFYLLLPPQISSVTTITNTSFLSIMTLYSFPSQLAATSVFFSEVPHKVFCWPCLSQGLYRFSALYPNGPCEHSNPKWIENSVRIIITGCFSGSLLDLEKHSCVSWFTCQRWSTYYFSRSLFCFWDVKRNQHRCQSYLRLIVSQYMGVEKFVRWLWFASWKVTNTFVHFQYWLRWNGWIL